MNKPPPNQTQEDRDFDDELVLTFLSHYESLEHALVRAGYTRAGRSLQADWSRFVRHIENEFDPDSSPVLQGAVAFLLYNEQHRELRDERIENAHVWENADPNNDIVWLSELIQRTRTRVIHSLNFPGGRRFDLDTISAAWFVLDAWSHVDPQVESLLSSGL